MTAEQLTRPVKEVFDAWWEENKETCSPLRMPLYGALMKAFIDGYMSGSDQELEAIVHWLITGPYGASIACNAERLIADLRTSRRPPVPSLKSQALTELEKLAKWDRRFDQFNEDSVQALNTVRKALESIPE